MAVVDLEVEILAQLGLDDAGPPLHLDDAVLQGMDHHLLLEGTEMQIPLLHGHQSPLHHLLAQPEPLLVGQQFAQGREIQDALPEEVVAELLTGHVALQIDDLARRQVDPACAVVLLQHESPVRTVLAEGTHDGWQDLRHLWPGHDGSMNNFARGIRDY